MNEKALKISVHFIAWLAFFMLPFVLFPKLNIRFDMVLMGILPNLVLVAYFYLNLHVLVPRYLLKKKYLLFLFFSLLIPVVIVLLFPHQKPHFEAHQIPEHFINEPRPRPHGFMPLMPILIFLLVFTLSTGIKLLEELFDARQKKQIAETAKSKAELATLKAQINPHFLFNTLNSIYSLSIENSSKTPDAIMRLSGMMRYLLTESESEFVPLSVEVDYLIQYIELQKLRLTDKTTVNFTVEGDDDNVQIAPLLLEPFVENAFKYGISAHEQSEIIILLQITGSQIAFSVHNQLFDIVVPTSKLGINNVKQRLQLVYPNRHSLTITDTHGYFNVLLEIQTI